jgi:hypothetical protein
MTALYRVNLGARRNADLRHDFELADTDLTAATLQMDIVTANGVRLVCSTGNGRIEITDADAGAFRVNVPKSALDDLPSGVHRHDLLMVVGGAITAVWEGDMTLAEGITELGA